jgi:pimeloyl-ACP methyl ester carboxylesterase
MRGFARLLMLLVSSAFLGLGAAQAAGQPPALQPWQVLPPTPAPVAGERDGDMQANGISIHYAMIGQGPPVILLHGGLANMDYWGLQVPALSPRHTVILMDSRGHGRSTRDARPFGYDLMADDVVALLDGLGVHRADVVGWSDGAIIGLDLALRYPGHVGRVFAFAANANTAGVRPGVEKNPVFAAYIARAGQEYRALSPTPDGYGAFVDAISHMWATEPNWSAARLRTIHAKVLIIDGDHDEAIRRGHTQWMASTIPGAAMVLLPRTSHFAFLQDPEAFNAALLRFVGDE